MLDNFLNDKQILELIIQTNSEANITVIEEEVAACIQKVETRLNFDSIPVMQQNLYRMYQIQVQLKNIYINLDSITRRINQRSANHLNIYVVKALFALLGKSITALGLDGNGAIILYNKLQSESLTSVINKCITLKQTIEKPTIQLTYLVISRKRMCSKSCIDN